MEPVKSHLDICIVINVRLQRFLNDVRTGPFCFFGNMNFLHPNDLETLILVSKDVRTTMIYTHVLNRGVRGVLSPGDRLK